MFVQRAIWINYYKEDTIEKFPDNTAKYIHQTIKSIDMVHAGKAKIELFTNIRGYPGDKRELERVLYEEVWGFHFDSEFDLKILFFDYPKNTKNI